MKRAMTIVGFIASLFCILGMMFKIMHWPGAGPMLLLGFASFSFYFLPVYGYGLFYEQTGRRSKIAGAIGATSLSLIALGVLFKLQHWPGSGPMAIVGWGVLCIFTFPFIMIFKMIASKSLLEKFLNLSWYLFLSFVLLGYVFKTFHMPGSGILLLTSVFMCCLYLILAFKMYNNDHQRNKLFARFLLITALLIQILLVAMSVSKDILNAFVMVDDGINETSMYLGETNNAFFTRFENYNNGITKLQYQKAQKVKELSDDLFSHIAKLKAHLIRNCDRIPPEIPDDSITLMGAFSKDNYDIPTHIMIGEPAAPKTGAWSGVELKAKLAVFRKDIISMYDGDKKEIMEKTLGLRTNDFGTNSAGEYETWEVGYFYHTPLASVIAMLSKFQSDVRYAESVTIDYLLGQAEQKFEKNNTVLRDTIPESNSAVAK